jgi:hypothetical protein
MPFTFYCGNPGRGERCASNTSNQLLIGTTTESAVTGAKLRVNGIVQIDNAAAFHVHRGAA